MLDHLLFSWPLEFSFRTRDPAINLTSNLNVTDREMANPFGDGTQMQSSQAALTPSREIDDAHRDDKIVPMPSAATRNLESTNPLQDGINAGLSSSNPTQNISFTQALEQYKSEQDLQFTAFESELEAKDTKETDIEDMEWDVLQAQFETQVGPYLAKETEIMERFNKRFQVMSRIGRCSDPD